MKTFFGILAILLIAAFVLVSAQGAWDAKHVRENDPTTKVTKDQCTTVICTCQAA